VKFIGLHSLEPIGDRNQAPSQFAARAVPETSFKQCSLFDPGVDLGGMPARRVSPTRNSTSKADDGFAWTILVNPEARIGCSPGLGWYWHPRRTRIGGRHMLNVGKSKRPGVTPSSGVPAHVQYTVV